MITAFCGLCLMAVAGTNTGAQGASAAEQAVPTPNWTVPVLHASGLMVAMRVSEGVLWPVEFANFRLSYLGERYQSAYTRPPEFDASRPFMRWDGDTVFINAVGHGLFGSEVYMGARRCGWSWSGSLVLAAVSSTAWEYAIETSGRQPSAQDLVYTPLMGIALGEARYAIWKSARGFSNGARALRIAMDPLGEFERALGSSC